VCYIVLGNPTAAGLSLKDNVGFRLSHVHKPPLLLMLFVHLADAIQQKERSISRIYLQLYFFAHLELRSFETLLDRFTHIGNLDKR
jgi:hypothetical protein